MGSPRKTRKDTKTKGFDFLVTRPSGDPTIFSTRLSVPFVLFVSFVDLDPVLG